MYLTVDYERRNFSVLQCAWSASEQQDIKSIVSPTYLHAPQHTLSGGQIAGTAVGGVVFLNFMFLVVVMFSHKKVPRWLRGSMSDNRHEHEVPKKERIPEIDSGEHRGHLIDGEPYHGPKLELTTVNELGGSQGITI